MKLMLKAYRDLKICPKGRFQLQLNSRKLKQSLVYPQKTFQQLLVSQKSSRDISDFKSNNRKEK